MKGQAGIHLNIPAQQRIRCDKDVSVCAITYGPAPLVQVTVSDDGLNLRGEPLQLILPVVEQGGRRNDQGRLAAFADVRQFREQISDALQRFAKAHIISQNAAEAVVGQRLQPLEPEQLIIAEYRSQTVRHQKIEILRTCHIGHQPPEGAAQRNRITILGIRIQLQAVYQGQ
ncbi:hypothetical protein D3C73_1055750 [compost metagenome]